jgi:hypothetical protein
MFERVKIRGAGYESCPACGGGMPHEVDDDLVCRCGTEWADPDTVRQLINDWEDIERMLFTRSSGRCEIRSPACLGGRRGELAGLPRWKVSFHHRRPRGMGGTKRADVHSLAWLVVTCGDGTTGCHGYVEHHGKWADARGLKAPKAMNDPAEWPLVLHSGRRVLLDPNLPWYQTAPGPPYALTG